MALVIEDDDRVRVLRIDRPDALNAMNNDVFRSIRDALVDAESDDRVAWADHARRFRPPT